MYLAVCQIQTVVLVVLGLGQLFGILGGRISRVYCTLRQCMSRSKVGNELGGILGCVDGEGLGNGEERLRECSDG